MSTEQKNFFELVTKENNIFNEVIIQLHTFGYERVNNVSSFGQYSVSGGVINIYSVFNTHPVAVDFFGNEIDKISLFNFKVNKKIKDLSSVKIINNNIEIDGGLIKNTDYVVHIDHGIGIYRGWVLRSIGNKEKSMLAIEYAGGDFLYFPETMIHKMSKYLGVSNRHPKLSRFGSVIWENRKKKIVESINLLAKELLITYAKRELVKRKKYEINLDWDNKLKKSFIHNETADQEKAIFEIYTDLKKDTPMDRLLVGDVGFGKTEVAVRAAAQVIQSGKQVAILAPTTILSRQHFATISRRFSDFPIKVAEMSRFVSPVDQDGIKNGLKKGQIDLLIGTHRLLKSDINFKNLGLLIIDEEQRFGVKDKEKLKGFKNDLDVLSLSATPIPRTLFISLSGIRQISAIKIPPAGRISIKNFVQIFDIKKIVKYIEAELSRGGQVFFLHNDLKTIEARANEIRRYFKSAKISVAHGQMQENLLAESMADFASGKIDILFCSTIIENGLDVQNANTLIVEDADNFGLSQLYQIRGRIGRGKNQAYAYFTHKKKLKENAFRRLRALLDKQELGSGFEIAYSDLEIRGGGNILGREQHGNMEELGLILYSKLLSQAVEKLKLKNEA